ncbi:hypothetical protein M501DRAFT_1017871 [Patellaria atrata CBS 101060]|uniref:Uncharacterized protein n=1 Tax=Patellaria atrata CBS 101060 TaxID=1346257 RepID=A0A9P4VLF9_9PEZI|nr:hypothetical protein M501DRAFT_1017871 [Patellaria atrata CBS 101060]
MKWITSLVLIPLLGSTAAIPINLEVSANSKADFGSVWFDTDKLFLCAGTNYADCMYYKVTAGKSFAFGEVPTPRYSVKSPAGYSCKAYDTTTCKTGREATMPPSGSPDLRVVPYWIYNIKAFKYTVP